MARRAEITVFRREGNAVGVFAAGIKKKGRDAKEEKREEEKEASFSRGFLRGTRRE